MDLASVGFDQRHDRRCQRVGEGSLAIQFGLLISGSHMVITCTIVELDKKLPTGRQQTAFAHDGPIMRPSLV